MAEKLAQLNISSSQFKWDHACFRCQDHAEYTLVKNTFAILGRIHSETIIGGRPIAVFQLTQPIAVAGWLLTTIECVAPTPSSEPLIKYGWEHMAVVPVGPCLDTLDPSILNLIPPLKAFGHKCDLRGTGDQQVLVVDGASGRLKFRNRMLVDAVMLSRTRKPDCILFDMDGTLIDSVTMLPFSESMETLVALDQKYRVIVWTGRDRKSTLEILTDFELLPYVTGLQSSDDGALKPNPAGVLHHLGPGRTVAMVGDSMTDMSSASALGIPFVHADWGLKESVAQKNYVGSFDSMGKAMRALDDRLLQEK